MGMFDTIMAELECPDCKQIEEREIQTKRGPSLMETYYVGDTISRSFLAISGSRRNGTKVFQEDLDWRLPVFECGRHLEV